jgi:uncharacterized protein (TIGR02246 family)
VSTVVEAVIVGMIVMLAGTPTIKISSHRRIRSSMSGKTRIRWTVFLAIFHQTEAHRQRPTSWQESDTTADLTRKQCMPFDGNRNVIMLRQLREGIILRRSLFAFSWNTHDADKMVSTYADDIDHINVFGERHKGKTAIREDIVFLHNGPARPGQRNCVIEKIRFLPPDVAVVRVSSASKAAESRDLCHAKAEWKVVDGELSHPTTIRAGIIHVRFMTLDLPLRLQHSVAIGPVRAISQR